jgi:hypothetical protein
LVEARAIARVAEPIEEIRDKFNRLTYKLSLDDGSDSLARFTTPLTLGRPLLYFGTETNPRPVDPLILSIDDLGKIP